MGHIVLLGDSIFDNARYVPDRPPVIEQVRRGLPAGWKGTLVAVDGHTVADVAAQLPRVPADATHLVVSAGGNDALLAAGLLREPAVTVGDALATVAESLAEFRAAYRAMLASVLALGKPTAVCTVYDAVPIIGAAERAALAGFNDTISRTAVRAGVPLIDLRVVCDHADDYSPLSPIEPSVVGGAKIADAICRALAGHDFATTRTGVWV
ncbi:MAG TPA: SGNH/GDSL hydrolase family protein [Gemmata sp.]